MDNTAGEEKIKDVHLAEELSSRYLSYAMSTIVSRSLPDVRDGLKPVHRRLLYAMRQLHLDPKSGFKKCARVVGDVIGKYHPHGDSAVYGAMVRLAQDFSVRYPLVDGQGNFGNIDGDGAAAMRYTEARLTEFAMALMEGLNDNAVDFAKHMTAKNPNRWLCLLWCPICSATVRRVLPSVWLPTSRRITSAKSAMHCST